LKAAELVFSAVAGVLIALFFYWYMNVLPVYDTVEMGMEVYVDTGVSGFSLDTDAIRFGILPPGGNAVRDMVVTSGPYKSLVTIEYLGSIAEWVSVSENNFVLEPLENRTVGVSLTVPPDNPEKDFRNGTLRIVFRMA
jgi:hypothetical protein